MKIISGVGYDDYSIITEFKLGEIVPIYNLKKQPIWDMYDLKITYYNGFEKHLKLFSEHDSIDNNIPDNIKKWFFIDRLYGPNGLIIKEDRDDYLFLGKLYKTDKGYETSRFYHSFYCENGKNAQTTFDEHYESIMTTVNMQEEAKKQEKERQEKNKLLQRIKKFGITEEEYDSLITYQGTEYFISNTLLHEVSLMLLMKNSPLGGMLENLEYWSNPENAIKTYCNLYSAMCKFRNFYSGEIDVIRSCSRLFKDEMKKTGKTASLLSFGPRSSAINPNEFQQFFSQREEPILLLGSIKENTPCFDYSMLYDPNWQPQQEKFTEVLVPAFMNITYKRTSDSSEYYVTISKPKEKPFTVQDESRLQELEKGILHTDVIKRYYEKCYECTTHRLDFQDYELEKEFFEWQGRFKDYLRLRFKKIDYELSNQYPTNTISNNAIDRVTQQINLDSAKRFFSNVFGKKNETSHGKRR